MVKKNDFHRISLHDVEMDNHDSLYAVNINYAGSNKFAAQA